MCTWKLTENCQFNLVHRAKLKQDSIAIAKKTARCAQYMGALKSFESAHFAPGYFFRNLQWTFVPINTKNVSTKFEVRSFTRSWDNRGYSKNLSSPWIRPRSIFSQIFNWLLFARTLWIYLPNLTFVALPIPEIIGRTSKSWGVPGFAHAPYSPKFWGLLFAWTLWIYLPNLKFVALSVPEIIGGTQKNLGSPWIRPHSLFSQNFKGLLFRWTLWIYLPNLTFVALPIPEIIGGTSKIRGVLGFAHTPYFPKLLKGLCSHGPCEYTCQVWSS